MKRLTPLFRGTIENGHLRLERKDLFQRYLISLEGKGVDVCLKKPEKRRSLKQNAYYWAVIIPLITKEMGELIPEETSDFMRSKLLVKGIDVKGKRYEVIRGTSGLSTQEFEDYLEKCRTWAAQELGINIPLPNEVDLI